MATSWRRGFLVDIGKPRRIIEIEPVSLPIPEVLPDPTIQPSTEPVTPVVEPAER